MHNSFETDLSPIQRRSALRLGNAFTRVSAYSANNLQSDKVDGASANHESTIISDIEKQLFLSRVIDGIGRKDATLLFNVIVIELNKQQCCQSENINQPTRTDLNKITMRVHSALSYAAGVFITMADDK